MLASVAAPTTSRRRDVRGLVQRETDGRVQCPPPMNEDRPYPVSYATPYPTRRSRLLVVKIALMIVLDIYYSTSIFFEAALLIALTGFVATAALGRYLARGNVME